MSAGVPVSEARALLSIAPRREVLFHARPPGLLLRVLRPHLLTFPDTEAEEEEGSCARSAGSGVAEAGRCRSVRGRLRLCLLVLLRSVVLPLLPGDRLENWEGWACVWYNLAVLPQCQNLTGAQLAAEELCGGNILKM